MWLGFCSFWIDFGHLWLDFLWFVALFWHLITLGTDLGALRTDLGALRVFFSDCWPDFGGLCLSFLAPCDFALCKSQSKDFGARFLCFVHKFWCFVIVFVLSEQILVHCGFFYGFWMDFASL